MGQDSISTICAHVCCSHTDMGTGRRTAAAPTLQESRVMPLLSCAPAAASSYPRVLALQQPDRRLQGAGTSGAIQACTLFFFPTSDTTHCTLLAALALVGAEVQRHKDNQQVDGHNRLERLRDLNQSSQVTGEHRETGLMSSEYLSKYIYHC